MQFLHEELGAAVDDLAEFQHVGRYHQLLDVVLVDAHLARVNEIEEDFEYVGGQAVQLDRLLVRLAQAAGKHGLEVGAAGRQNGPMSLKFMLQLDTVHNTTAI